MGVTHRFDDRITSLVYLNGGGAPVKKSRFKEERERERLAKKARK